MVAFVAAGDLDVVVGVAAAVVVVVDALVDELAAECFDYDSSLYHI
jgi:hypothetical protein